MRRKAADNQPLSLTILDATSSVPECPTHSLDALTASRRKPNCSRRQPGLILWEGLKAPTPTKGLPLQLRRLHQRLEHIQDKLTGISGSENPPPPATPTAENVYLKFFSRDAPHPAARLKACRLFWSKPWGGKWFYMQNRLPLQCCHLNQRLCHTFIAWVATR